MHELGPRTGATNQGHESHVYIAVEPDTLERVVIGTPSSCIEIVTRVRAERLLPHNTHTSEEARTHERHENRARGIILEHRQAWEPRHEDAGDTQHDTDGTTPHNNANTTPAPMLGERKQGKNKASQHKHMAAIPHTTHTAPMTSHRLTHHA